jgi:hypothetical protein
LFELVRGPPKYTDDLFRFSRRAAHQIVAAPSFLKQANPKK